MKKTTISLKLISIIFSIILFSSCSLNNYVGSGNIITQEKSVGTFDKIKNPTFINIVINYGVEEKVVINADDNIMDLIKIQVNNSELAINLKSGEYQNTHISINITMPSINAIDSSGSSKIICNNFPDLTDLSIKSSGSGQIKLSGTSLNLNIKSSGSCKIKAYDLEVSDCQVKSSGSGDFELFCNNTLKVNSSGSGDIFYKGTANVTLRSSGSGQVISRN